MQAGIHAHSTTCCNLPAAHRSALSCPHSTAHVTLAADLLQPDTRQISGYATLQLQTSPCQSLDGTHFHCQGFHRLSLPRRLAPCHRPLGCGALVPSSGFPLAASLPDLVQAPTPRRLGPLLTLCASVSAAAICLLQGSLTWARPPPPRRLAPLLTLCTVSLLARRWTRWSWSTPSLCPSSALTPSSRPCCPSHPRYVPCHWCCSERMNR